MLLINLIRKKFKSLKKPLEKLKGIKKNLNNDNKETLTRLVRLIIDEIRFFYKSRFYKHENEYRIIWLELLKDDKDKKNPQIEFDENSRRTYMNVEKPSFLFNKDSYAFIGAAVPQKEEHAISVKYKLLERENPDCKVMVSKIKYVPPTERAKFVIPKTDTQQTNTK